MTTAQTTNHGRIEPTPAFQTQTGGVGGPPTLGDILAMLRRRLVMVVVLFFLFSGLAIGGFASWWLYFPGYLAESLIECISNIPETELTLDQQRLQQDEHERFVRTQALLLKSPGILGEALKVNAVRETGWYELARAGNKEPLIELDEALSAAPVRGTNFLRVAIQCRNRQDAPVIVNEVVNQWYHAVKKRTAEDFATEALDAARDELRTLEDEIADKRTRLKVIAQRLPAGARQDPARNITAQQVLLFGEQIAQLQLELSQLEQYRAIYSDPEGGPITAEDRAIVEQDPQVAELTRAVFLLSQQRAADAGVFGEGHQVLRQIDAQIGAAEEALAQRRLEKLRERRADIREAANTAYENTRHALFLAQDNLLRAEAQLRDQDLMLFDYYDLLRKLNQDREYEVDLDAYIKGLSRVKAQRRAIRVNVAQAAIEPLKRHSPTLWLAPVGVFFSLVLAMTLGIGIELLDKSVRTPRDIATHLGLAVLGVVPDTNDEEVAIDHVETAVRDTPRSMVAEAFRRIRTSLEFSAPAEQLRSVAVTSARSNDGKTTVACNLAMAIAQRGRRVLLVDGNMRRPGLHEVFERIEPRGLSNILVDDGSLESCVTKTDDPMLDLLGAGPAPPNPVELLAGPRWGDFLKDALSKYDQVVIDTPPVLVASDGVVIATTVDGVILTVRANRNSRGVARRACSLLANVNARVFGTVLNAARVTRGGYFREQLRDYYEYQAETPETEPGGSSSQEKR